MKKKIVGDDKDKTINLFNLPLKSFDPEMLISTKAP